MRVVTGIGNGVHVMDCRAQGLTRGCAMSAVIVKAGTHITIYGHVDADPSLTVGATVHAAGPPIGHTDDTGDFKDTIPIPHVHVAYLRSAGGAEDGWKRAVARNFGGEGSDNFSVPC
jgi:hypothetical protein